MLIAQNFGWDKWCTLHQGFLGILVYTMSRIWVAYIVLRFLFVWESEHFANRCMTSRLLDYIYWCILSTTWKRILPVLSNDFTLHCLPWMQAVKKINSLSGPKLKHQNWSCSCWHSSNSIIIMMWLSWPLPPTGHLLTNNYLFLGFCQFSKLRVYSARCLRRELRMIGLFGLRVSFWINWRK